MAKISLSALKRRLTSPQRAPTSVGEDQRQSDPAFPEDELEYVDDFEEEATVDNEAPFVVEAEEGLPEAGELTGAVEALALTARIVELSGSARIVEEEETMPQAPEDAYPDDFEDVEEEEGDASTYSCSSSRALDGSVCASEAARTVTANCAPLDTEMQVESQADSSVNRNDHEVRTEHEPSVRTEPAWELIQLGDLEMGALIANGAMGGVYTAIWKGMPVAAKILHDTSATQVLVRPLCHLGGCRSVTHAHR